MIELGTRQRSQPPPPWVVYEALIEPNRDPNRQWLILLRDERAPTVASAKPTHTVIWTSLWPLRPDALVRFDLDGDAAGTSLRWTLSVEEPQPDAALARHMCSRLDQLINSKLRKSFGQ